MKPNLDEIEARAKPCSGMKFTIVTCDDDGDLLAEFLRHLMQDIPALLAYCRALEEQLTEVVDTDEGAFAELRAMGLDEPPPEAVALHERNKAVLSHD